MKILLVDDEPPLADMVRRLLTSHQVVIETRAARALERVLAADLESRPFDLVLCDVELASLAALLRRTREPPLIVLMSDDRDTKIDTTIADGILSEPFTRRELEELVGRIQFSRARATTRRLVAIA